MIDRVEVRNFFEELISAVSQIRIWKVSNGSLSPAQVLEEACSGVSRVLTAKK
jgi:hypothetical protein